MKLIDIITFYGFLTSVALTLIILISLYAWPRIWLKRLPGEVKSSIPQKTKKEKKQTLVVMMLFLIILIGIPAFAVTKYSQPTILQAWFICYSICFLFNLIDLLIIDWLFICTITPRSIRLKGVNQSVYKDYSKHLKNFFMGIFVIIIPSFLSGVLGFIISKI